MRLFGSHRREVIRTAEGHLLHSEGGRVQFLEASFRSPRKKRAAFAARLRRNGASPELVKEALMHFDSHLPRAEWNVSFLLFDDRFNGGVTLATVTVDHVTGARNVDLPLLRGDD
jgi:hypothetical protein